MTQLVPTVRRLAVLCALTIPACSVCNFEAQRQRSTRTPAAGLNSLSCTSHNGGIEIVGVAGAETVEIEAMLRARGETQDEAEEHVDRLDVSVERRGAELVIAGVRPGGFSDRWNAVFAFRITAPPELAQNLTSHNGGVTVEAMAGELAATTHNGRIRVSTRSSAIAVETHNGSIELELLGAGPVAGSLTTHNGAIEVHLGERAAVVDASTQNGRVDVQGAFAVRRQEKDEVELVAGQGGGKLSIVTHNGGVSIR